MDERDDLIRKMDVYGRIMMHLIQLIDKDAKYKDAKEWIEKVEFQRVSYKNPNVKKFRMRYDYDGEICEIFFYVVPSGQVFMDFEDHEYWMQLGWELRPYDIYVFRIFIYRYFELVGDDFFECRIVP